MTKERFSETYVCPECGFASDVPYCTGCDAAGKKVIEIDSIVPLRGDGNIASIDEALLDILRQFTNKPIRFRVEEQ